MAMQCHCLSRHWPTLLLVVSVAFLAVYPSVSLRSTSGTVATTDEPEELVEVLAGTDMSDFKSNGNTMPYVKRPWGFNDWVPQTVDGSYEETSFWFSSKGTEFHGIRCTHQPSPWIGDYGHFLVVPHAQENIGTLQFSPRGSTSIFRPYLFSAKLVEPNRRGQPVTIRFELTPTDHAALIRATFSNAAEAGHLSFTGGTGDLKISEVSGDTLRGSTDTAAGGTPPNWRMYFIARVRGSGARWTRTTAITAPNCYDDAFQEIPCKGSEMVKLTIARRSMEPLQLELEVATSFISAKQAELNLKREVAGMPFDRVVEQSKIAWRTPLSRVKVAALSQEQLRIFYTNLWKAMLFPRFLHEQDEFGQLVHFSPYNGKVEHGRLVADSGFWDAYHSVYPLQSIAFPDVFGNHIEGWVNAYKEAGWLPTWPSPGQRGSMQGTTGDVVLADAITKSRLGIVKGFDVNAAYAAIHRDAFDTKALGKFGRRALMSYVDNGYYAEDEEPVVYETTSSIRQRPPGSPQWPQWPRWPQWPQMAQPQRKDPRARATAGSRARRMQAFLPPLRSVDPLDLQRQSEPNEEGAPPRPPVVVKHLSPSYETNPGPASSLSRTEASVAGSVVGTSESVSLSLLSYLEDAAIAHAADALGHAAEAAALRERSKRYGLLFNNQSGFFQPRRPSGEFYKSFDPNAWRNGFTEGNAWHYRFAVPHDIPGLQQLHKGQLCKRIEEMLTTQDPFRSGGYFGTIHEMLEAESIQREFGVYNHCNQPVHEVLWIAKKAGCDAMADKYLRKVLDRLYTINGWCGDEDNGEMSSWYILTALGLYSLEPGKDELVLGSPALFGATIHLPAGRVLKISTINQAPYNVRVASVTWTPGSGGLPRKLVGNVVKYSELMMGGELRFTMTF